MLKLFAIRTITGLSWRLSRQRIGNSLQCFSQVEDDSGWQMLRAMQAVEDPEFQASLFNNALEEMHHSALFGQAAKVRSERMYVKPAPRRSQIFNPELGLRDFEAYHFVGEADVYRQFLAYAQAIPDRPLREMFLEIRGDEEGHQELALAELRNLFGSDRAVRAYIRKVRLKRLWHAWSRLGQAVAASWAAVILTAVYMIVGPLFCVPCRKRLRETAIVTEAGAGCNHSANELPHSHPRK